MKTVISEKVTPAVLGLLYFVKANTGAEGYVLEVLKEYMFDFVAESGRRPHEVLEEAGYIKYIKSGKKDPVYRVRLSALGEKVIKDMEQKPVHELAEFTLNLCKQEYQRIGADKSYISGGGKLLHYISEFLYSRPSEYNERMIQAVLRAYADSFQHDQKYLNKMSTLFFKPTNAYATKFTVEDSPICKFIDQNTDNIKYYYRNANV